ncbi:MAG TPA: response regulator [Phycisphaerae bacterium]|nr:response regulator [Phycisphaerae bacterium]HNU46417.1 response regulator [Phycisphaerae bacterium]
MADTLRLCLFDTLPSREPPFRGPFEQLKNALILGDFSQWDELREWLKHGSVDLVAVNLDGDTRAGLETVERITQLAPKCGILGLSSSRDPGSIIAAMRAGCSQFVCWPVDQADLEQAVERIRATRMSMHLGSKRFCVIGSSGGAGATTVACNLAMELGHLTDRRAGLVDLNLEFGDVACAFDCTPKFSVADVCREGVDLDRLLLSKAMHELPCNVSILARPDRIEDARAVTPEGVEQVLKALADMFPYIVVDLPRAYSFLSAAALRDAERVIVVTQLGVPFIRNATRIYECLLQMNTEEERIEIVLNRCKASFERITPEEVEAHFGRPIFATIPNDYRRVQSSLDFGHPIVADAPASPARVAIQEMARRLTSDNAEEPNARPAGARPGLWGKLWKRSPAPAKA